MVKNGILSFKKHIQLLAMKENGQTNSVDLFFIHTALLILVVNDYVLCGKKICVNSQITDKNGQILILDVPIDGLEYILVKFYNGKRKWIVSEVLNDVSELMKKGNITKEAKATRFSRSF